MVERGEEEIDVAVGECAKNNDDNKAISDNAKLFREGKDTIDGLLNNLRNSNDEVITYIMQMAGPSCALPTMHLAANGLYAAKRRHTFSIPYRCSDLDSLPETLECLLTMKKETQLIADKVIKERKKTRTTAVSFNEQKKPFINDKLGRIRGAWYTPPSG